MDFSQKPWWQTDAYTDDSETGPLNLKREDLWGPVGAALVPLFPNGKTGPNWGRETFMAAYTKREFAPNRILHGYRKEQYNYAWIMRSTRLICIDIDGKNGGLEYASQLGFLPPTTSEISKSGNGYHLFYLTEDTWDAADGFGKYRDHIGFVTGVDIRGTGCVYHHPAQRWNDRLPVVLPKALSDQLLMKSQQRERQSLIISKTLELDNEEILMLHDEILTELAKPIPAGKRNNTLFAIGQKMKEAQIPEWEVLLEARAEELGLDDEETVKLVANIGRYN